VVYVKPFTRWERLFISQKKKCSASERCETLCELITKRHQPDRCNARLCVVFVVKFIIHGWSNCVSSLTTTIHYRHKYGFSSVLLLG